MRPLAPYAWQRIAIAAALLAGCGEARAPLQVNPEPETSGPSTSIGGDDGESEGSDDGNAGDSGHPILDIGSGEPPDIPDCRFTQTCHWYDILFVIDNSRSMAQEQLNIAANIPRILWALDNLTDYHGNPLWPDVHIMVTTGDVGHPLCPARENYAPAMGAPQTTACIDRLEDFMAPATQLPSYVDACAPGCPVSLVPPDPYIAFNSHSTNVPGNNVEGAMRCLLPQGIAGCEYQAPLEAARLALDPQADWNLGPDPFLRPEARLVVVFISDGPDCSVHAEGLAHFTDPSQTDYWEVDPDTQTKTSATPAVCWNAGVDCGPADASGVFPDCTSVDNGVLYPTDHYLDYFRDGLSADFDKQVMVLGVLGVPPVTAHNPDPPFEPTAGGVFDLVYREWVDDLYPLGDLLPTDTGTAADMKFQLGVGPGCMANDGDGTVTRAQPPMRVKEVCEGLDTDERVRCCIGSICEPDFSHVFHCLISWQSVPPSPTK